MQADLFTLDFTRITRHEAGCAERWFERCIIVQQSTGNTVARCARLARLATASDVDLDIKRFCVVGQH